MRHWMGMGTLGAYTAARTWLVAGAAVLTLAGCGISDQSQKAVKSRGAPVDGAGNGLLTIPALTPGSAEVTAQNCQQVKLYADAQTALRSNCYGCHGKDGKSKGGPADATDLQALVQKGLIVPRDVAHSPLCQAVVSGKMPPAAKPRPPQSDVQAIGAWVEGGAAVFAKADQLGAAQSACQGVGDATKDPSKSNVFDSGGKAPTDTAVATATSTGTSTSTGAASSTATGTATSTSDLTGPLAQDVVAILNKYCAGCHGATTGGGGLSDVANLKHLIDDGYVTPGDLPKSKLYTRMTSTTKPMPPANKPTPTPEEVKKVADWIQGLTAPGTGAATGTATGGSTANFPKTPNQVFTLVAQDLQAVSTTHFDAAPFTRYVSFAHLAAQGATDQELEDLGNNFSRQINSLSTNRRITRPVAVDPRKTVFRFDIRDYNWRQQDWEDIIRLYPYRTLQRSASLDLQFRQLAQTELPIVNGDWFAFQATQPPLYNILLQLDRNGVNDQDRLERFLGIDTTRDLELTLADAASQDQQVMRLGFRKSGVALNNRAVDRHTLQTAPNGSFWQSFDFRRSDGNSRVEKVKDVFAAPLGPVLQISRGLLARLGANVRDSVQFAEDASEIIFTLPNGMLGYFVVDGNGRRLDAVDPNIAVDPKRGDRIILNGYSCMTCHGLGLLPKKDEVGPVDAIGSGFNADEKTLIRRLYAPQPALDAAFTADSAQYLVALKQASYTFDQSRVDQRGIVAAGYAYEGDFDLKRAAWTLGMKGADFRELLIDQGTSQLKQSLAGLLNNGTVTREAFEGQFPRLVQDLLGREPTP